MLVEGFGLVGLEEEHEKGAVAMLGLVEGLHFEVFDEGVAGLAPGLGELGVLFTPAVGSRLVDTRDGGGSPDGSTIAAGFKELRFLAILRTVA